MLYCRTGVRDYVQVVDWQQMVSLGIVGVAAVLMARGRLRRGKLNFERRTHCGCSAEGSAASGGSILFHARKGERSRVVVRMG
jgi:hypothetical protein